MVCCIVPCIGCLQKRVDMGFAGTVGCLIITEIIRWIVCTIPVYLASWRYAEVKGYTVFIEGQPLQAQYWGVVTGITLAVTVFIYAPLKGVGLWYRIKYDKINGLVWRPSVLFYLIFSVLPCLTIITVAYHTSEPVSETMDAATVTVMHGMVLGLTFTEWLSKVREELITYDLISAMAEDFFFAYDVIEFISLPAGDLNIYNSNWSYACLVFSFISMFKYIPTNPTTLDGPEATSGKVRSILVSMFCCDIPFVIIRISTLIIYKFSISDLIYPVKNVALIVFDCTQLYMISRIIKERNKKLLGKVISVTRLSRNPECWETEDGTVYCDRQTSTGRVQATEAYTDEDGNVWLDGIDGKKSIKRRKHSDDVEGVMIKRRSRGPEKQTPNLAGKSNDAFNRVEPEDVNPADSKTTTENV